MIQMIRLGVQGSEVTLPTVGRSLTGTSLEPISLDGRAADGTLRRDFIAIKRNWSISYSPISESNANIIQDIYNIQLLQNSYLSLIITDGVGTERNYTVDMSAPQRGALIQRDVYYYQSLSFEMREV